MAQFTNDVQPVQSPMQPTGGVVDSSAANALGSSSNILANLGEGLFGTKAIAARKAIEKGNENSFVASYEQQALKIADAVDQGLMGKDEARMRMRANYSKALSNFHGDPDDLAAAHARIVNTTGLGKVIETGNRKEQQEDSVIDQTMKAGWTDPSKSREEQLVDASHYQQYMMAADQLKAQQDQIGLQRAQIGLQADKVHLGTAKIEQQNAGVSLQTARINLVEKQQEFKSRAALGQMQDSYNYKFQNDLDGIKNKLDKGEIDAKQATMLIQQKLAAVTQLTNGVGRNAGSDYIENMLGPMKMRADNMLKYVSGEIDGKLLDQKNHNALAYQTSLITGDPESAQIAAASELFKNAPFAVQKVAGDKLLGIISKNGSSTTKVPVNVIPDNDSEKSNVKGYLDTLKAGIAGTLANSIENPEKTKEEINTNLGNVLKGISLYGAEAEPKDFNDVVDFLSRPEVGRYLSEPGNNLSPDLVPKAEEVIRHQYKDVLIPLAAKELNKNIGGAASLNPNYEDPSFSANGTVRDLVQPTFSGTGMVIMPKDPKNQAAVKWAKQLNGTIAPVVNKLIRMSAHLQNGTDYKKAYEDSNIVGELFPEEVQATPAGE